MTRCALGAAFMMPLAAMAADVRLTNQGRLTDALGSPIDGGNTLVVSLWSDATSIDELNDQVYSEDFGTIDFDDGYYSVILGNSGTLQAEDLVGDIYIDIAVGGVSMVPRALLSATPLAATVATPTGSGVPTGAVMPFDLTTCPDGWSEYTPARGRFIRGLDSAGSIDPDGSSRSVGSVQADALGEHTHTSYYWNSETTGGSQRDNVVGNGGTAGGVTRGTWVSDATGGAETRPVNVALLYCRKD